MTNQNILGGSIFALNPAGLASLLNGGGYYNSACGSELDKSLALNKGNRICFAQVSGREYGRKRWPAKLFNASCCGVLSPHLKAFGVNGRKVKFCALNFYLNAFPKVLRLLPAGGPLAVTRLVMPVGVYSVKGKFAVSAHSNVLKELLKTGVKELNSAPAVVFILTVIGVFATGFCGAVTHVGGSFGHSVCLGPLAGVHIFVASATYGVPGSHSRPANDFNGPAIALTEPMSAGVFTFFTGKAKDGKFIEFAPREVAEVVGLQLWLKNQFAFIQTIHAENKNAHVKGYPTSKMRVGNYVGGGKIVELSHSVGSGIKIRNKPVPKPLKSNKPTLL